MGRTEELPRGSRRANEGKVVRTQKARGKDQERRGTKQSPHGGIICTLRSRTRSRSIPAAARVPQGADREQINEDNMVRQSREEEKDDRYREGSEDNAIVLLDSAMQVGSAKDGAEGPSPGESRTLELDFVDMAI